MILSPEIKIKQIRELKNYTQEYVATQLGLTTRAYSKIESGETQLTINRLNEISSILGGGNNKNAPHYKEDMNTTQILKKYNPDSIVPGYSKQVVRIMKMIDDKEEVI